jgi:hypothetical protein
MADMKFWRLAPPVFVTLLGLLIMSGCNDSDSPTIDIVLDRGEISTAELLIDDGRAIIEVTDPRGINGLTATLTSGQWPEQILVHLRLKGLERLEIHYGRYTITTGRSSNDSPDPPLILHVADENGEVTQAPVSSSFYFPDIRRTDDGFEVGLPPHFFRDEYDSFSLQWIDFYRQ